MRCLYGHLSCEVQIVTYGLVNIIATAIISFLNKIENGPTLLRSAYSGRSGNEAVLCGCFLFLLHRVVGNVLVGNMKFKTLTLSCITV